MTTRAHHLNRSTGVGLVAAAFLALASLIAMAALPGTSTAHAATGSSTGSYGWPVAPFDEPHPVRGSFGDPRTLFKAPPTTSGLLSSDGSFSFHQGVDIAAPNGSPVYPVANGVVTRVEREWIRVDSGNGRAFEYWHIRAEVRAGARVEARETVLGRILKPAAHVHLTQLQNGRAVNPLAPGRLTPYRDTTTPQVNSIGFRRTATSRDEMPHFLRGRLHLVVDASDTPTLRVPGIWAGLPVTPSLVTWRIQRWTGKVVVGERVARDVRETVPQNRRFWSYYARGTYQNMAVFGPHYSYLQQGCYLFELTRTPFDTHRLPDGVYDLVVTVADTAGNSSSRTQRFTVHNRGGWVGS